MNALLLIFGLLLTVSSSATLSNEGRLTPLRFGHYPAFKHTYAQSPHYHWLSQSLGALGYRIQVVLLPNKRLIAQLNDGMLDGDFARLLGGSKTSRNQVSVPEPFAHLCYMGYKWPGRALPTRERLVIGTFYDWDYAVKTAKEFWPESEHFLIQDMASPVHMLRSGRVDLLFMPSVKAAFFEREMGIKLEPATEVIRKIDTYVQLHKRHQHLTKKLAEQLRYTRPKDLNRGC